MEKGETVKRGTIEITLTLRGEPAAVVHALAEGLPVEALVGIRDGMTAELEHRLAVAKLRPRRSRPRRARAGK